MAVLTWPEVAQKIVLILLILGVWGIAYSIFPENVGFRSDPVTLAILFVGAKATGYFLSVLKCPPILGQMFFGIILQNTGYFNLTPPYQQLTSILRQVALVNIMLPAGLNLDSQLLVQWGTVAFTLGVLPATIEVLIVTALAVLLGVPILWAIMMGLILAAVSPSVVFPCLFYLEDLGYGLEKGVNNLVVVASTINDIISIALFIAHLGIVFSDEPMTAVFKGPIGFIMGVIFGVIWGYICRLIPHKSDEYVITLRTLMIGVGSVFVYLGSNALGYSSAGTLGCITAASVASQGWRREGSIGNKNPIKLNFMLLWKFFEPISFGLIGVEVKLYLLRGLIVIWLTLISLVALIGRALAAFLVGYCGNFTFSEKVFFAIAAVPKATVQAALGPLALEHVRNEDDAQYAMNVLILSVISIVLTAPFGACLILTFGPKLLPKSPTTEEQISLEE